MPRLPLLMADGDRDGEAEPVSVTDGSMVIGAATMAVLLPDFYE